MLMLFEPKYLVKMLGISFGLGMSEKITETLEVPGTGKLRDLWPLLHLRSGGQGKPVRRQAHIWGLGCTPPQPHSGLFPVELQM